MSLFAAVNDQQVSLDTTLEVYQYILGSIFMLFAIIYSISVIRECRAVKFRPEGYDLTQVFYISALVIKSICLLITPSVNLNEQRINMIVRGLPGYVIATSYCFILLSWCEVCKAASSEISRILFTQSQRVLKIVIVLTLILFAVFCTLFCFNPKRTLFHTVEGIIAIVRDVSIAISFIFYICQMRNLFEHHWCELGTPESKLYKICILVTFALIYRAVTIVLYMVLWKNRQNASGYSISFMVDQIVCEFAPLIVIGSLRFCPSTDKAYLLDSPLQESGSGISPFTDAE